MFASHPVARSRFSWITGSTDGGRRSIWASMDTMESRLPGPERNASMRGALFAKWLTAAPMADSTRAMRRTIYERELLPVWRNRLLTEITPDDLRAHCGKIVDRSAPATAIHVRDIVKQIYGFAILHGEKVANPADEVGPASIATFVPRDRSLSPSEIRVMLKQLEHIATLPTIRLGMKLYLLTMVRKSELQDAVWDEVDFENSVWTIPKERMKRSKAHNVYLSRQTLDIMIALKTCAGSSVSPSLQRCLPRSWFDRGVWAGPQLNSPAAPDFPRAPCAVRA
jgi:integrase